MGVDLQVQKEGEKLSIVLPAERFGLEEYVASLYQDNPEQANLFAYILKRGDTVKAIQAHYKRQASRNRWKKDSETGMNLSIPEKRKFSRNEAYGTGTLEYKAFEQLYEVAKDPSELPVAQ